MRKSTLLFVVVWSLLGASVAGPALASGSYSARPPQPPAKTGEAAMKLDREKYGLGQKVYEGGIMTAGAGDVAAQTARLQAVQMKLPADAAKAKDLVALAGKLTAAQLEALEYFVEQRFVTKK